MLRTVGINADIKEWRDVQRTDEVADEIARFQRADFILVVASPEMRRLMDSTEQGPVGDTTHVSAALARDRLARNLRDELKRMLPVVLSDATVDDIPRMQRSYSTSFYQICDFDVDDKDFRNLLHVLRGVPQHAEPPLGRPYPLPSELWQPDAIQAEAPSDVILRDGATVVLDGRMYLVHDQVEAPDGEGGPAVLRQARALLIGDPNERVWLRQVERKADARDASEAFAALGRESELLDKIRTEHATMPRPAALVDEGRTRTLVLEWPSRNVPPKDFETLADYVPHPGELDSTVVRRGLEALAGLCPLLEALHQQQCTHRELAPHTIVRIDEDRLALRDLGAAGRPARPGGDKSGYRAPEQTLRARAEIGPWTDVFRLAAVAHHLISGRLPDEATALPVRAVCPVVPDRAAAAIDAALHPDPARRPAIHELAAELRM